MSSEPRPRIMTVDVEDWFHIIDCPGAPDPGSWDTQESRVAQNTDVLIDLLARHRVRATFFVLGWVARRHPEVVRRIVADGHEVASHGWSHTPLGQLGAERFGAEARDSKALLEDLGGQPVLGFRAPGFSMTDGTAWAFDALADAGYRYDASIVLGYHSHGGLSATPTGGALRMLPLPTLGVGRARLPFTGGGYLRLLPLPLVDRLSAAFERGARPLVYYLHPREIDPYQPRMRDIPLERRFKHYIRLDGFQAKLERILVRDTFVCAREALGFGPPQPAGSVAGGVAEGVGSRLDPPGTASR